MNTGDARSLNTFKRELPVKLEKDEWMERSSALSVTHRSLDQLEEDEKQRRDEFKARKQDIVAAQKRLAKEVETHTKFVMVACETYAYDDRGEVLTVRLDTGEVIERRGMREEESPQLEFDDE